MENVLENSPKCLLACGPKLGLFSPRCLQVCSALKEFGIPCAMLQGGVGQCLGSEVEFPKGCCLCTLVGVKDVEHVLSVHPFCILQ